MLASVMLLCRPLLYNVYLQMLHLLSTVAFLQSAVASGNPLVRLALGATHNAIAGLVLAKIPAVALAIYCWRSQKTKLLSRINVFYALLVVWNLVALIAAGVAPRN
jgi:hypothetical protein